MGQLFDQADEHRSSLMVLAAVWRASWSLASRTPASRSRAVPLACYEANASALAGNPLRAGTAMRHAEEKAAALGCGPGGPSPWSFPPERMTIFRLSVALRTGDPDGALAAASGTSTAWDQEGPHVPAVWA